MCEHNDRVHVAYGYSLFDGACVTVGLVAQRATLLV